MKKTLTRAIAAASLVAIAQTVSAQVLFSDNFNGISGSSGYPATPTTGANFELGIAGRQGGTLATPTLDYLNRLPPNCDGNEQLGNPNTLPANGSGNVGDNLLLANTAGVWINHNFSDVNAPLKLTFDGVINSGDPTDWLSVLVGNSAQDQWVLSTTFSILFRENGGTQYFSNGSGTTGASGVGPGNNVWQSYGLVLSDTAGTGSAFAGNGSKVDYYANGQLLGTASINQLSASDGYIGFGCPGQIAGIDNIVVAVPEPSAALLVPAGFGLLALIRRYCRA